MGIVCPFEATKDAGLLARRDADALIFYTQLYGICLLVFTQREIDTASLGAILDGIGDEVAQHLLDAAGVPLCPRGPPRGGAWSWMAAAGGPPPRPPPPRPRRPA